MSDLQKTPVVDKNGVQTTRNKRTEQPVNNARIKGIPAPVSAVPSEPSGSQAQPASKEASEFAPKTLADIEKAADLIPGGGGAKLDTSGADSSVPEGYLSSIGKVLGITTVYILKEAESGNNDDAVIVGRVELGEGDASGNVYLGNGVKGGYFGGRFKNMEDAVRDMIDYTPYE